MRFSKVVSAVGISILALVGSIKPADATSTDVDNYWSTIGTGCVPDNAAIESDVYLTTNGSIQHATGNTSLFVLNCTVERNTGETNPDFLFLSYSHSAAGTINSYVKVEFWRKSRTTGSVTSIASQNTPGVSAGTDQIGVSFTHTLDFNTYYYYIQATLDRTSTEVVKFYGTGLGDI